MHYFYVLENTAGELYFGYTSDLQRRLREHAKGNTKSTKRAVWSLVYYEAYKSEEDAKAREERIKYYGQAWSQLKRRISRSRQQKS